MFRLSVEVFYLWVGRGGAGLGPFVLIMGAVSGKSRRIHCDKCEWTNIS